MNDYIEKEIKVKVNNPAEIVNKLKEIGAEFLGGALEKTIRFDTPNMDFEKAGKFIRCRSGFHNTITLKEKLKNADSSVRARKETEFNIEDIEKMKYILESLGLTHTMTMEKYRQNWQLGKISITLDELCFGIFMEIEGEESEIEKTCQLLGVNPDEKILVTYWELWHDVSNEKDIIFDNNHNFILKR